jgi:hypothetical protein
VALVAAVLALHALWPARADTASEDPSPVVYPPQRIPIRYSHRVHIQQEGMKCLDCHDAVRESWKSADLNLPKEARCAPCHAQVRDPQQCAYCHPGPEPPAGFDFPAAFLRFDHRGHVGRGARCLDCHPGVPERELATVRDLPRMAACLECHQRQKASTDCSACHPTGPEGRVAVRLAGGTLKPASHRPGWDRAHRAEAEASAGTCLACHAEADCLSCHDGSERPAIHPADWVVLHPQAAISNETRCQSCHRLDAFCTDCHSRTGVKFGTLPGGAFHPAGWASPGVTPSHHSHVARRNIEACASCHAEPDCIACHGNLGGPRVNPHPSGVDLHEIQRRNPRACLKCHAAADPLLQ